MPQQRIHIRLESDDFDCDRIQLIQLGGKEAISRLFSFDLHITSLDPDAIDPGAIVGAGASIVFDLALSPGDGTGDDRRRVDDEIAALRDGGLAAEISTASLHVAEIRRMHGMIAEVEDMLDSETSFRTYRLKFVPRAHRLTLVTAQEIFLDQSVPEIIQAKLERVELQAEDFEMRLLGTYPKREFVVQYKETDLAFISRLAEHLGISFHFEHDEGRDKIVFSDDNSRFRPIEGDEQVMFRPRGEPCDVYQLSATSRMIPAVYGVQDYHYLTPRIDLTGMHELRGAYAGGVIEYGAHTFTPDESAALARTRAEEHQATQHLYAGESDVCRLRAGATCKLEGHPRLDRTELLLTEIAHQARQVTMTHGSPESASSYTNTFRAVETAVPFRPPRITPKPTIAGVLCGVVEPHPDGDIGQYAQIDEHGRYTVRFFFDTSPWGERTRSSLPVRMSQPHAGPSYGMHFPLKPGVEVLVAFTEGDPDRPFIVGSVPNPITPSPVTRPNAIVNRIETASGVFIEMKDV